MTVCCGAVFPVAAANILPVKVFPSEAVKSVDDHEFHADGPYVFYKKKLVLVRSVERQSDGTLAVIREIYNSKDDVPALVCKVDNAARSQFKVRLHSDYTPPPSTYEQPEKLFALADIEGNFDAFVTILKGNGIINDKFEWTFGKGHLVLNGDFFDRGNNVTAVLWLIYELERQAALKGGMVHFIIGNHEEMTFRGDTRYVTDKYFQVASAFNTSYTSLFAPNTELGQWLRSKNVIEKIGNTLFAHGGLSPNLANCHNPLKEINKVARSYFGKSAWKVEHGGGTASRVFGMDGPMWYRGYFNGQLQLHEVSNLLALYGASEIVVGHTIVPYVSGIYKNKVIAIDVKHCTAVKDGTANALLIENGEYFAVNAFGHKGPVYPMLTENDVIKVLTAIRESDTEAVAQFLEHGNSVNKYYSNKQYTLLHYAIKNNQPEMVSFLLKNGANIEQTYDKHTPLMYAIRMQRNDIANILVKFGADVNALNIEQESPLFYCAKYGNLEIMKFLIANGADVSIKDAKGYTVIDYALKYDKPDVIDFLKSL